MVRELPRLRIAVEGRVGGNTVLDVDTAGDFVSVCGPVVELLDECTEMEDEDEWCVYVDHGQ